MSAVRAAAIRRIVQRKAAKTNNGPQAEETALGVVPGAMSGDSVNM